MGLSGYETYKLIFGRYGKESKKNTCYPQPVHIGAGGSQKEKEGSRICTSIHGS